MYVARILFKLSSLEYQSYYIEQSYKHHNIRRVTEEYVKLQRQNISIKRKFVIEQ